MAVEKELLVAALTKLCIESKLRKKTAMSALLESYEKLGNEPIDVNSLPKVSLDYEHNGLKIELDRKVLQRDGKYFKLTGKEWQILELLIARDGKPLNKSEMAAKLYDDWKPDSNVLEVFMSHLRKKVGNDAIHTMRGVGYVLAGSAILKT